MVRQQDAKQESLIPRRASAESLLLCVGIPVSSGFPLVSATGLIRFGDPFGESLYDIERMPFYTRRGDVHAKRLFKYIAEGQEK